MTLSLGTLAITLASWGLLLLGAISAEAHGLEHAVFGSFLAIALLLLFTRKPGARRPAPPGLWVLGLVSGFASYPLWAWAISRVGLGIGLAAAPESTRPEGLLVAVAILGVGL